MTKFHCIVCAVQSCYCLLFLLFIVLQFHKISYGERSRSLLPSMVTYMQYINSFHTRPLSMLSCRPGTCKSATLPLHKFDPFFIEIQCMSKNIKYVCLILTQLSIFRNFCMDPPPTFIGDMKSTYSKANSSSLHIYIVDSKVRHVDRFYFLKNKSTMQLNWTQIAGFKFTHENMYFFTLNPIMYYNYSFSHLHCIKLYYIYMCMFLL